MKRIHIVGVSPRTGTTLMAELMVSCFRFDGHGAHEFNVRCAPVPPVDLLCTKRPGDVSIAAEALRRDPNLWIICLVRDPRDVIVSKHKLNPDAYWAHLGFMHRQMPSVRACTGHPRFLLVRYEDLTNDPDAVQQEIESFAPFLEKQHDFSAFHRVAKPSKQSERALGGTRPVSTSSIGRWREHLPRVKAQIERYGPLEGMLTELGYAPEEDWPELLDDVVADNGRSHWEDKRGNRTWLDDLHLHYTRVVRYWRWRLGVPERRAIVVPDGDGAETSS